MQDEKKNLILAVVTCLVILLGFHFFYEKPRLEHMEKEAKAKIAQGKETASSNSPHAKSASSTLPTLETAAMPTQITPPLLPPQSERRIPIETPKIKGTLNLKGARLDDLSLTSYKETTEKDSKDVKLLTPNYDPNPYYAEFGFVSTNASLKLPTAETEWHTESTKLSPQTPVTLTWDNGQGFLFERTISVDENYVFSIHQKVKNTSAASETFSTFGLISRGGNPPVSEFFVSYEGPIGYLQGKLKDHPYKDLKESKKATYATTSGWLGFSDKYWLTALVPNQHQEVKTSFNSFETTPGQFKYQTDFVGSPTLIAPGQTFEDTAHFYAGAKVVELLDSYEKSLGVPHFDLAVDFGWFYFITKPTFFLLIYFYELLGNFGLAILLLTVFVRLAFFPLSNKAYRSMARMKALQPQLQLIKEQYGHDKTRFHQETMEFYKRHKLNPVSGCLPFLIQMPVFFALYKVLYVSLEMRHAPFYGWLSDLSAADPTTLFNLFGLIPWDPPSFLHVGLLPIIMGGTMWLQQRMNPQPMDEIQTKLFAILPLLFTYLMSNLPAGLILYWAWGNILAIIQQRAIMVLSEKKGLPKAAPSSPKKKK